MGYHHEQNPTSQIRLVGFLSFRLTITFHCLTISFGNVVYYHHPHIPSSTSADLIPGFVIERFDYVIKHHMYNIDFVVTNKDISDMLE